MYMTDVAAAILKAELEVLKCHIFPVVDQYKGIAIVGKGVF